MHNPSQKRSSYLSQIIPMLVIGIGLVVIGLVTPSLLTDRESTEEFSVIPARVDFKAPELALGDLNGQKVNLANYRQQIVLINNWATWCPPCKSEMPTLQKYYQEHSGQGFMLIGIEAGDAIDEVTSFVSEYKLTFPIWLDPNEKSLIAFHNDSLPSSYVIDHAGKVVLAWTGPISDDMLEKYVTPLLEQ